MISHIISIKPSCTKNLACIHPNHQYYFLKNLSYDSIGSTLLSFPQFKKLCIDTHSDNKMNYF